MGDKTYGELVEKLRQGGFKSAGPELRYNILNFYFHYKPPYATREQQDRWNSTVAALYELKDAPPEGPQAVATK